MRRLSVSRVMCLAAGIATATLVVVAIPTGVATADARTTRVQIRDDCDPVSFNQALGPGACVGDGDTTFNELIAALIASGRHPEWAFRPARLTVENGTTLVGVNKGGEAHSFTEVAAFGGGCVQALNDILNLTPVPECGNTAAFPGTIVGAGQQTTTARLPLGTHLFQCLIHPWMRMTVKVTNCCGGGDCGHCS